MLSTVRSKIKVKVKKQAYMYLCIGPGYIAVSVSVPPNPLHGSLPNLSCSFMDSRKRLVKKYYSIDLKRSRSKINYIKDKISHSRPFNGIQSNFEGKFYDIIQETSRIYHIDLWAMCVSCQMPQNYHQKGLVLKVIFKVISNLVR